MKSTHRLTTQAVDDFLADRLDPPFGAEPAMLAYAAEIGFPIVGRIVGQYLAQLVAHLRPNRIFELGSGFGYSALYFARAANQLNLPTQITLTDIAEANMDRAREWLSSEGLADRCTFLAGDAIEHLRTDAGPPIDLILCDIDKEGYADAYTAILEKLSPAGTIIVDNALWGGRVLAPPSNEDSAATRGVRAMIEPLLRDPNFATTLNPIRDGVLVATRISNAPRTAQ